MKTIAHILAALAFIVGVGLLVLSFLTPYQYNMAAASAIQAQQVFAIADHVAILGIGTLLAGLLLEVSVLSSKLGKD